MVDTKVCSQCKIEKTLKCFSKKSASKDGLKSSCKECASKSNKILRNKNKARVTITVPTYKTCYGCHIEKPQWEFSKDDGQKDGLNSFCKECKSKATGVLYINNKNREVVVVPEFKTCGRCRLEKSNLFFNENTSNNDGLNWHCKECQTIYNREARYGLTIEQINAMLLAQSGACPICKVDLGEGFVVDHEHVEGWKGMPPEERKLYVRGLLHHKCNLMIGFANDSSTVLQNAICYLDKQKENKNGKEKNA